MKDPTGHGKTPPDIRYPGIHGKSWLSAGYHGGYYGLYDVYGKTIKCGKLDGKNTNHHSSGGSYSSV